MGRGAEVIELTRRLPTSDEIENAAEAATALANAQTSKGALELSGKDEESIRLAPAIVELLVDMLGHVAQGNMVTIMPTSAMLTTQQAADILNVSRPFLSGLLKSGVIPFVPVGSHRRVMLTDLLAYKEKRDAQRTKALDELARLGQVFDAS